MGRAAFPLQESDQVPAALLPVVQTVYDQFTEQTTLVVEHPELPRWQPGWQPIHYADFFSLRQELLARLVSQLDEDGLAALLQQLLEGYGGAHSE